MNKCLILSKLKMTEEKHNVGFWILVNKDEEAETIASLGNKFIFSFDLDEVNDETLLQNL
jgi:acyl-ACP thioesterase